MIRRLLILLALVYAASVDSGQGSTDNSIFVFNGKRVFVNDLMGVSRGKYVSAIMPLFSWNNNAALSIEVQWNYGAGVNSGQPGEIESAIGRYYDEILKSRLNMLLAELVVNDTGVKGFHYDKDKIESIKRDSSSYEAEWDEVLLGICGHCGAGMVVWRA